MSDFVLQLSINLGPDGSHPPQPSALTFMRAFMAIFLFCSNVAENKFIVLSPSCSDKDYLDVCQSDTLTFTCQVDNSSLQIVHVQWSINGNPVINIADFTDKYGSITINTSSDKRISTSSIVATDRLLIECTMLTSSQEYDIKGCTLHTIIPTVTDLNIVRPVDHQLQITFNKSMCSDNIIFNISVNVNDGTSSSLIHYTTNNTLFIALGSPCNQNNVTVNAASPQELFDPVKASVDKVIPDIKLSCEKPISMKNSSERDHLIYGVLADGTDISCPIIASQYVHHIDGSTTNTTIVITNMTRLLEIPFDWEINVQSVVFEVVNTQSGTHEIHITVSNNSLGAFFRFNEGDLLDLSCVELSNNCLNNGSDTVCISRTEQYMSISLKDRKSLLLILSTEEVPSDYDSNSSIDVQPSISGDPQVSHTVTISNGATEEDNSTDLEDDSINEPNSMTSFILIVSISVVVIVILLFVIVVIASLMIAQKIKSCVCNKKKQSEPVLKSNVIKVHTQVEIEETEAKTNESSMINNNYNGIPEILKHQETSFMTYSTTVKSKKSHLIPKYIMNDHNDSGIGTDHSES